MLLIENVAYHPQFLQPRKRPLAVRKSAEIALHNSLSADAHRIRGYRHGMANVIFTRIVEWPFPSASLARLLASSSTAAGGERHPDSGGDIAADVQEPDVEYRQLPLVQIVPAARDRDISKQDLEQLEAQVMIDVAAAIRSRIATLPPQSLVVRDLGRWADLLANAGAAHLPGSRVPAVLRSA